MKNNKIKMFIPIEIESSNLDLIKWISEKDDANKFIIDLLKNQMNKEINKITFTKEEIEEIAIKFKEMTCSENEKSNLGSKDLDILFGDDSFWN